MTILRKRVPSFKPLIQIQETVSSDSPPAPAYLMFECTLIFTLCSPLTRSSHMLFHVVSFPLYKFQVNCLLTEDVL